ncbi:MAG: exonuclease [Pedobacter sp.]|nr:MAG: exonuclease [Pedobacter sp.]
MILSDFIVEDSRGLYCRYGDFFLDPKVAVKHAVISHAHGDHAIPGNSQVYCTAATAKFMQHRFKKRAAEQFHIIDYTDSFILNGVKISFFSAGHILGSALIVMEYQDVRYLYTGDFKTQADPSCDELDLQRADVLICESTFADPQYVHPEPMQEIQKLNEISSNIMLGAYALGKAQRLISLINQYCPQKQILLHYNILPFAAIYESFGFKLGNYKLYDRKAMKNSNAEFIYIVPPMVYHSYIKAIDVVRIFASGWKHLQNSQMQLLISDHADWAGLLYSIEQVQPREIWTTHGSGKLLQAFLESKIKVKMLN